MGFVLSVVGKRSDIIPSKSGISSERNLGILQSDIALNANLDSSSL